MEIHAILANTKDAMHAIGKVTIARDVLTHQNCKYRTIQATILDTVNV